jgi:hypothetical protein
MTGFTGYATNEDVYGGEAQDWDEYESNTPERPVWEDHFDNDREAGGE